MTFRDDVKAFIEKTKRRQREAFVHSVTLAYEAITEGSPITGSPGQLVRRGALKLSWQTTFDGNSATIITRLIYARQMEEGTRDGRELTQRSEVGGFHSIKLLVASWDRIEAHAWSMVAD